GAGGHGRLGHPLGELLEGQGLLDQRQAQADVAQGLDGVGGPREHPELDGRLAVMEEVGQVQDVVAVVDPLGQGGVGEAEHRLIAVVLLHRPAEAALLPAAGAGGGEEGLLEVGDQVDQALEGAFVLAGKADVEPTWTWKPVERLTWAPTRLSQAQTSWT